MRKNIFGFLDWGDNFYDLFNWPFENRKKAENNETGITKKSDGVNFLQVLDDFANWPLPEIYTPKFVFDEEQSLWVYKTNVGRNVKPENIELYIAGDGEEKHLNLFYESGTCDGASMSCASAGIDIPGDEETLKATLKGGVLTITCKPKPEEPKKEEKKEEFDSEQEYEINIENL